MLKGETKGRTLMLAYALVASVGVGCAALVAWGNPGNMGICGACFLRDTGGALGLFAKGPKIFRPELVGLLIGALAITVLRGRFAARSGSHAATRLFFGAWMGIGALVFLGCPFRMLQRLGGGDLNALPALVGFIAGVGIGLYFERRGYRVGKTAVVPAPIGLLGVLTAGIVLALYLVGDFLLGPGFKDTTGPPHAPLGTSLAVAAIAGAILAATRFCAVSAARQVFLRDKRMLIATGLLILAYALASMATGRFELSAEGQPAAHSDHIWSALAMALVGLCGCLTGGCPVRQVVMTGEGNGDAFMTVVGITAGGAIAHNLGLAASGKGTTEAGQIAVIVGLALALPFAAFVTRSLGPSKS